MDKKTPGVRNTARRRKPAGHRKPADHRKASYRRFGIQAAAALLQNANFKGFFTGKIYDGPIKQVCVPGLNCYSCPGAVGACPIGSLQNILGGLRFRIPYYVLGILIFFGALLGRAVCGFLCPFGWLQELLHKIPFYKKKRFKADKALRTVKYFVLAATLLLPLFVKLTPFFCNYLCPSGTLAGVLLSASNSAVRGQLGWLFTWKAAVLLALVAASLVIWRPFCKYLCPLGAIYGFFNRIALYRMDFHASACVHCGACAKVCRMNVDPAKTPNSMECIRCGDCVHACPQGALRLGFRHGDSENRQKMKAEE